jgi:spore germination protein
VSRGDRKRNVEEFVDTGSNVRNALRVIAGATLAALFGCPRPAPVGSVSIGGWIPYWDAAAGMGTLALAGGRPSDVFLFVVQLDASGNPVPVRSEQEDIAAVEAIRRSGGTPWLTVVNDVVDSAGDVVEKDPAAVHEVLTDPDRLRDHVLRIGALARRYGVSGVDLDYEALRAGDRDLFSRFVAELREELAPAGMGRSLTVQPKTRESVSDGPGAADWATLCRSADRLQIMLYDEHGGKTDPGPISTPAWIEEVLRLATGQCPAGRIVAAIKVIGMEWGPEGTRDMPYAAASSVATAEGADIRRFPDGDVPWFTYAAGGQQRTVYFEDARSLRQKLLAVKRQGVSGVVLWSLGAEDPGFWAAVDDLQKRPSSMNIAPTD